MNQTTIGKIAGLFTIIALAIISLSQNAWSDTGLNGDNVTTVNYTDPTTNQNVAIKWTSDGVWTEHSPNGAFKFREVDRDEWSVYLYDANRSMGLQIDLYQKVVKYGQASAEGRIISLSGSYPIKSAS